MTNRLTVAAATEAARSFVAAVSNPDRQWDVGTVEGHLPDGWKLSDNASDQDFFPVTIKNVTNAMRTFARQA